MKAVFNWSGGKDSALSLYKVLRAGEHQVLGLLTSVNSKFQRISMHGVRVELLEQQANSIGLSLIKMEMPEIMDMRTYEEIVREVLMGFKTRGVEVGIFGDIFLEDLRRYREDRLAEIDLKAEFPIWKVSTKELVREFIDLGFKAIVVCVDEKVLDKSFAGREINDSFLHDLPINVDSCGEYGEFHSFVYDGPIFKEPVRFKLGEAVYRTNSPVKEDKDGVYLCNSNEMIKSGFWFQDLCVVDEVLV